MTLRSRLWAAEDLSRLQSLARSAGVQPWAPREMSRGAQPPGVEDEVGVLAACPEAGRARSVSGEMLSVPPAPRPDPREWTSAAPGPLGGLCCPAGEPGGRLMSWQDLQWRPPGIPALRPVALLLPGDHPEGWGCGPQPWLGPSSTATPVNARPLSVYLAGPDFTLKLGWT